MRHQFEAILPIKVEAVVELLISQREIPLPDALEYLYSSTLYSLLECEETKMWYYSPQMLLYMLDNEKKDGQLTLPQ